ncbi:MAG: hypothetical protein ABIH11_00980 [Candidatus Altiarchaeota archaeon]
MMEDFRYHMMAAAAIAVILFLIGVMVGMGLGYYAIPSVMDRIDPTTTTTTSSTTTTTTSTTTTSTTTSTTSTTTTTMEPFYVCAEELMRDEFVETECYGKTSGEYYNSSMKSTVWYVLNNTAIGDHASNRVKVVEDTCYYTLKKLNFQVGALSTCVIPQERNCTLDADLITD